MEMTQPVNEVHRGQQAQEAIENPLIAEALAAWESEIVEAWRKSPLRDVEGRERLRLMLEAAAQFQRYLRQTMDTGKLARVQVERQRTKLGSLKSWAMGQ